MKPNTVAGPRPICTALPHFPCLLNVQLSLRGVGERVKRRRLSAAIQACGCCFSIPVALTGFMKTSLNQPSPPAVQFLLRGKRKIRLSQAGQLAGCTEQAREMWVGIHASGEPGVAENVGASLTGGNHVGHLRFLFGQGSYLRTVVLAVPVCELGHPNLFVVLVQAVQLV